MYKPFKGIFFGSIYKIETKNDALKTSFYNLYRCVKFEGAMIVGKKSGYPGVFVVTFDDIYFAEDKTPQEVVVEVKKGILPDQRISQDRVEESLALQMIDILESKGIDWMAKEI